MTKMRDDAKNAFRRNDPKRGEVKHVSQTFCGCGRRNRPQHCSTRSNVRFGLVARRRLASWLAWRRLGLGRAALLLRRLRLWRLWLPAVGRNPMGPAASLGMLIGFCADCRERPWTKEVRGLESFFNSVFPPQSPDRTISGSDMFPPRAIAYDCAGEFFHATNMPRRVEDHRG